MHFERKGPPQYEDHYDAQIQVVRFHSVHSITCERYLVNNIIVDSDAIVLLDSHATTSPTPLVPFMQSLREGMLCGVWKGWGSQGGFLADSVR